MSSAQPTELVIEQTYIPTAAQPQHRSAQGDKLSVHYTGTFYTTGASFDSSLGRNKPFEFTLGVGQVIQGWDEGLLGMVAGEKRRLTIPPQKAYGEVGWQNRIPPNSALVFEVELVSVTPKQT